MHHLCRGDSIPVSGRQCGGYGEGKRLWCVARDLHRWMSMSGGVWPLLMVAVLLVSAVFPLSGCKTDEATVNKLDSRLLGLIDAEKRGETESFARMAGFDLVDGAVSVGIESKSGQFEAMIKAVAKYGTIESVVESAEAVKALVPIASLTALAREESISCIRDPVESVPE